MPPPSKKDVLLFIFDLKSSNKNELLEMFVKLATYKMLMSKASLRVLLANSLNTSNAKNVPNVFETNIETFDPQQIFECVSSTQVSDSNVNLYDTLLLAIHYIKQACELPEVINLQIIYFTDLLCQIVEEDDLKLSAVVKNLNENDIYLYLVGPDAQIIGAVPTNPTNVPECMKNILGDESNEVFSCAKLIVQKTERSILCDLKVGLSMVMFFRKSKGAQAWQVPLSIGSLLNIPSKTSKIYNDDNSNLRLKAVVNNFFSRTYVLKDDSTVELPGNDLIQGVLFHSKFIKIDDEDMFKFETERSFDIIGFTSSKSVSEAGIGEEGTFHVLPGDKIGSEEYELFHALIRVLVKEDKYGIVQRIYNKNNNPKFFVLKPDPESRPCRFIMTDLPYADDILGKYLNVSIPKCANIKTRVDDFSKFCQSLDIYHNRCCIDNPVPATMMLEVFTKNTVEKIAKKLCCKMVKTKNNDLPSVDTYLRNDYWNKLQKSWPAVDNS